jgi:hypothetical protein
MAAAALTCLDEMPRQLSASQKHMSFEVNLYLSALQPVTIGAWPVPAMPSLLLCKVRHFSVVQILVITSSMVPTLNVILF